jgi:hypothetical protein
MESTNLMLLGVYVLFVTPKNIVVNIYDLKISLSICVCFVNAS